jgi:prophage regulatory protein
MHRLPEKAKYSSRARVEDPRRRSEPLPKATGNTSEKRTSPSQLDRLPLKLLRFPIVRERTGLSRSTVWRLERRGEFPRHVQISANIVAWREDEVTAWIESRAQRISA